MSSDVKPLDLTNLHMVGIMEDVGRHYLEMRLHLAKMRKSTQTETQELVYNPVNLAHLPPHFAILVTSWLAAR